MVVLTAEDFKVEIKPEKIPKHIAVILDGNRRFARKLMMQPWKGHEWGAKKVEELLNWCYEAGIKEVTLFAFSLQNFNRPKEEFNYLMNLFRKAYNNFVNDKRIEEYGIRVKFIGRINLLPEDLQLIVKEVEERTKNNNNYFVNIAMAYGGREEIVDAVKKLALKIKNQDLDPSMIDENIFSDYLALKSNPDMVIRTGGEKRTSNFLIWQTNYSEWFFLEKSWPEFTKKDFLKCLKEYSERERRFGR